jgi:nucleotide-binding universal stress UspA family protein
MAAFERILVPFDFSTHSESAAERAAWIASRTNGRIHLLHACSFPVHGLTPYEVVLPNGLWEKIHASASDHLEQIRAELAAKAGVEVTAEVTDGVPGDAILAASEAFGADLIIMGTRGRTGIGHMVLGSVAERTLRTASCPVLAVKEGGGTEDITRILVGVDFSEPAEAALTAAAEWANRFGAELHVAHAFDLPLTLITPYEISVPTNLLRDAREAASAKLEAALGRARAIAKTVDGHLIEAPAAPALAEEAERIGASLIVVGSRGHTGLKHLLLGSVAERTVRLAPCAVLALKTVTHGAAD